MSGDIFPAVAELLVTDSVIQQTVRDRINIGRPAPNVKLPCITVDDDGEIIESHDLPCVRMKISCWAEGKNAFSVGYELRKAVINCLYGFKGEIMETRIVQSILMNTAKVEELDTGIIQFIVFFIFKYI